jgi:hypothetical protein
MTLRLLICVLAANTALAQAPAKAPTLKTPGEQSNTQSAPPTLQKRDERPAEVPPNQPVITIQGLCPAATNPATNSTVPSTKECSIKMTKEQFTDMVKAFNTNNQPVSVPERRKLAESYVDILIFAEAGKAAGVDKTPNYEEVMRVLQLKTLADIYLTQLSEQFRNPSPEEIEANYQANQGKYESAKLSRIYIPKSDPDPQATPDQKQAYLKKVVPLVDDIQTRAGKGEPLDKLEKEAFTTMGISGAPPNTEMNPARRGMFPPKIEQDIFSHNAGEVFRADDDNGYLIYRVEKRETAPLDSVKAEVVRATIRSKMDAKVKELKSPVHANLEEKYFGPPATPTMLPGQPGQSPAPR